MLSPHVFITSEDRTLCDRLIQDILDNKHQRPLGYDFPYEGMPNKPRLTFGSFLRQEHTATLRYELTREYLIQGVEVRYHLTEADPVYEGVLLDWELKW